MFLRTRGLWVMLSLFVAVWPSVVAAQECGSLADAGEHLQRHRAVFEDPEWADERAALGLDAIQPGDPVEEVTDPVVCSTVIGDFKSDNAVSGELSPAGYAVYRYGPYHAIEFLPPGWVGDTFYHGYEKLFIYTVGQGRKYKGILRVAMGGG